MNKLLLCISLVILLISCKEDQKNDSVEEETKVAEKVDREAKRIMDKVIENAGGKKYETAIINFSFRGKQYQSRRDCGMFEFTQTETDSNGTKKVRKLDNVGFKYTENDKEINLADTTATAYAGTVNSVHYFVQLPFGLNDKAVHKKLIGEDTIQGKAYYEIRVSFAQDGGGEDFQDEYLYWVNKEEYTVDYLAYSYEVNEGGMRFREAFNPRIVEGIRFVDYHNFAPAEGKEPALKDLDELFENGELKKVSDIINTNISVELLDHTCD